MILATLVYAHILANAIYPHSSLILSFIQPCPAPVWLQFFGDSLKLFLWYCHKHGIGYLYTNVIWNLQRQ